MKRSTKWLLGGFAIAIGTISTAGAYWKRRGMGASPKQEKHGGPVWARPGMKVTFRAELMPGRDSEERSFRVKELLPSGRVSLRDVAGEHTESEFEPVN